LLASAGAPPESVILACTHYPLVADLFAAALPPATRMIDQPAATAEALKRYLALHPGYDVSNSGKRNFRSTGFSAEAMPLIERFWGSTLPFMEVGGKQPRCGRDSADVVSWQVR